MQEMPRPRPLYLHRYTTRHSKTIWYVRKPGGKRIRIRGEYDSQEFTDAYLAAIGSDSPPRPMKASAGTVAWLWGAYCAKSTDWKSRLSAATKRQRENIMAGVLAKIGDRPFASVRQANIISSRDDRADTPAQARNFLDAMRALFRWAKEAKHIGVDPTDGVKNPERLKGEGFLIWTEEEVDRYYARWPIGTKERIWIDILMFTGMRRGDAVKLGRQHIRDGVATFRTEKSGKRTEVNIPILPVLQATLAAGPCADLAFICGKNRRPLVKETFGNMFKTACKAAGIDQAKKAAHGLRKVAATRAADNGATVHQLMAIFGWKDIKMAQHYTEMANRKRLARAGMSTLERTPNERSMCSPTQTGVLTSKKVQ